MASTLLLRPHLFRSVVRKFNIKEEIYGGVQRQMKGQEKRWGQDEVSEDRSKNWRYRAEVGDRKEELDEQRIKYR